MKDKKDFIKKVWAMTLGDGTLEKLNKECSVHNSRYCVAQIEDHKDYIDYQVSILEDLTAVTISYKGPWVDDRGYNCKGQYRLKTRLHPLYTKMRERIYPNGYKTVCPHYLKLIDWECMAILYQDDGYLTIGEGNKRPRSAICTYNFSYGDNLLLREAIKEKLGVLFDISPYRRKDRSLKYYLRASVNNTETFVKGIAPYVLPSFEYKTDLSRRTAPE